MRVGGWLFRSLIELKTFSWNEKWECSLDLLLPLCLQLLLQVGPIFPLDDSIITYHFGIPVRNNLLPGICGGGQTKGGWDWASVEIGSGVKCQRMASIIDRCPMSMPIHVQSLGPDYVLFSPILLVCWLECLWLATHTGVLHKRSSGASAPSSVSQYCQLTRRWLCQWCDSSSYGTHVTVLAPLLP